MLPEIIKTISKAEEEARLEILLAHENAQAAIEAAHITGKDSIATTLARAESEIAHLTRTMDQKATEEAIELASTTANRQATLHARAERRLDAAATLIFERIVNV